METIYIPADSQTCSEDLARGLQLRDRANTKTVLRSELAPVLGLSLAFESSTTDAIAITAFTAFLEWTDFTDGHDARVAAELLGEDTTLEGAQDDHLADKKKFYSQMLGLIARSLVTDRDMGQAAFVGLNTSVQATRDYFMNKTRDEAIEEGIDPKARIFGKAKGLFNGLGAGAHTLAPALPENQRKVLSRTGNIFLGLGTVASLAGLAEMKLHVARERSNQGQ